MTSDTDISLLPLERTWLADVVDSVARQGGKACIEGIVIDLIKNTSRELGKEGEATITRTINNYSINSGDTERSYTHPVFRRIAAGEYALINYPDMPDLVELQQVRFSEHAYKLTWDEFCKEAEKFKKWKRMSQREKLSAFARNLSTNEYFSKLLESNKRIKLIKLEDL